MLASKRELGWKQIILLLLLLKMWSFCCWCFFIVSIFTSFLHTVSWFKRTARDRPFLFAMTNVRCNRVNLCTKMTNLTSKSVQYNRVFVNHYQIVDVSILLLSGLYLCNSMHTTVVFNNSVLTSYSQFFVAKELKQISSQFLIYFLDI